MIGIGLAAQILEITRRFASTSMIQLAESLLFIAVRLESEVETMVVVEMGQESLTDLIGVAHSWESLFTE
jgi:hypothetical protein